MRAGATSANSTVACQDIEPSQRSRIQGNKTMNFIAKSTFAVGLSVALIGCNQQAAEEADTGEANVEAEAATEETAETAEAPAEPVEFDLAQITCWDLSTSEDEDRAFASTMLYGYAAGQAGQSAQNSEEVEARIVSAIEFCVENPDSMALEAFKQG
ncbi:HdeA/HdeB family chaperone [Qipengyuania flava]|uniref:HdeA/HdeB family chaperone n=1 Tax=Qipengyuania flava TaxID=192812 RepID=UPI00215A4900|nr:HdeA/HdeB family chaperone [Qipengyuania flava]